MQAEWVILTIVVILLVSKLFSVFGTVPASDMDKMSVQDKRELISKMLEKDASKVAEQLDDKVFLDNARLAFALLLDFFVQGKKEALKGLCSNRVYDALVKEIDQRQEKQQKLDFCLVAINSAEILSKEVSKKNIKMTISFVSEQMNVLRDKDGNVLEGDPIFVGKVKDTLIFECDKNKGMAWIVSAIKSEAIHA